MQIWNGCNVPNITGNPIKDINAKHTFLRSASKVERWLPPWFCHLVAILEFLLLHVLSNDACKFAINPFPISWEPFENVNLLYFLLKMRIWNGCNVPNIAGNPIKDINAKLTFLRSASKVKRWLPPWFCHLVAILEILLLHVLSNDTCKDFFIKNSLLCMIFQKSL